ncbi:MAG: histidinol dehydrogenase [Thermosediminibacterales bacterium]|nr:histidinol dehydrogenase [Thermosediminibacterales bacterium]MDK2835908.1 histidinol dehydrogenase [Thermosediminibacterales bacterium]
MIKIIRVEDYSFKQNKNFMNYSDLEPQVKKIIYDVKIKGDKALFEYTERFDGVKISRLEVTQEEFDDAFRNVEEIFLETLKTALKNIRRFHEKQIISSWQTYEENGIILGQKITPLNRIGAYIPGGTAAYPSSVLMTVVPAKVAGVREVIVVSPPMKNGKINPYTLVAAHEAGADKVFKIGGAQAIAALAYGSDTIPFVDKIVGPGNIYVTLAKKLVYGDVDIDMLAGPSEILVIADESANPSFVASDLLSQAEHDVLAAVYLVTPSYKLARQVNIEIEKQIKTLSRKDIIVKSLKNRSAILVVETIEKAFEVANQVAPEHLELHIKNPFDYIDYIKNAGAIFIGPYSPEALGDYLAGPSHVLPTAGSARYYSGLGVKDFIKHSSIIYCSKKGLKKFSNHIIKFAEIEGLDAHANSIKKREEKDKWMF